MKTKLIALLAVLSASLASAQSLSLQNTTVRVTGTPGIISVADAAIVATPLTKSTSGAEQRCESPGAFTVRGSNQLFVCDHAKQWVALNSDMTSVSRHVRVANLARISAPVCTAGQAPWANVVPNETGPSGGRGISYTLTRVGDSYVLHIDRIAGKTAPVTASVNTGCA